MSSYRLSGGSFKQYTAIGEDGTPVWQNAEAFIGAIRREPRLGDRCADFLAVPKFNERSDHVDWYVPFEAAGGEYQVISWDSATPEERRTAMKQLSEMEDRLVNYGYELEPRALSGTTRMFAHYLTGSNGTARLPAMHFPGPECVYIVNGKPVITYWGFLKQGSRASGSPFTRLRMSAAAAAPGSTPAAAAAEAAPAGKKGCLWPILLLLLLLLIGGLGYWLWDYLSHRSVIPGQTPVTQTETPVTPERPVPAWQPAEPEKPAAAAPESKPEDKPVPLENETQTKEPEAGKPEPAKDPADNRDITAVTEQTAAADGTVVRDRDVSSSVVSRDSSVTDVHLREGVVSGTTGQAGAADTVNAVVNGAAGTVNAAADGATDAVNAVVDGAAGTVNAAADGAADAVNAAVDGAAGTVNAAADDAADTVNAVVDDAADTVNAAVDGAADTVNAAVDGAADTVNAAVDGAADTVNAAADGAADTVNSAVDGAADTVNAAVDGAADNTAAGVVPPDIPGTGADGTADPAGAANDAAPGVTPPDIPGTGADGTADPAGAANDAAPGVTPPDIPGTGADGTADPAGAANNAAPGVTTPDIPGTGADGTPAPDGSTGATPPGAAPGQSGSAEPAPQTGIPAAGQNGTGAQDGQGSAASNAPNPGQLDVSNDGLQGNKPLRSLTGRWNSRSGLRDAKTNLPLNLQYEFGQNGQGQVTVVRNDGTRCIGTIQGGASGGTLQLSSAATAKCPDGSSYNLPSVSCTKDASGRTVCRGTYDGKNTFPISLSKQ